MLSTSFISILYVPIGKPAYHVLAGKPAEFASSANSNFIHSYTKASVIERIVNMYRYLKYHAIKLNKYCLHLEQN